MDEIKIQSPLRAIKEKCMDCCCWQREAVKAAPALTAPFMRSGLGKTRTAQSGS